MLHFVFVCLFVFYSTVVSLHIENDCATNMLGTSWFCAPKCDTDVVHRTVGFVCSHKLLSKRCFAFCSWTVGLNVC